MSKVDTHDRKEMNMVVSPVCQKDDQKFAFVQFSDGVRRAEGKIPMCDIVSNEGFTKEEVEQLEEYMKANVKELKKLAARQNPFRAIFQSSSKTEK